MSTVHITHLLSEYMDGLLPAAPLNKVKSHLVFCIGCRHVLADLESNRHLLQKIGVAAVPAELEKKIIDRLNGMGDVVLEPAEPPSATEPVRWGPWAGGLGLLAVIAVVFSLVRTQPANAPSAPKPRPAATATPLETPAPSPMNSPVEIPSPSPVATPTAMLLSDTMQGHYSGIETPLEKVITSESEWKKLWKNHTESVMPAPAAPEVDFKENSVIAVFLGTQSSGGYSVDITKIEETTWEGNAARIVHYQINRPREGTLNTMALTQPFQFKVTPKFKGQTFFRSHQ